MRKADQTFGNTPAQHPQEVTTPPLFTVVLAVWLWLGGIVVYVQPWGFAQLLSGAMMVAAGLCIGGGYCLPHLWDSKVLRLLLILLALACLALTGMLFLSAPGGLVPLAFGAVVGFAGAQLLGMMLRAFVATVKFRRNQRQ